MRISQANEIFTAQRSDQRIVTYIEGFQVGEIVESPFHGLTV